MVANDGDGCEELVRQQEERDEVADLHLMVKHPEAAEQQQHGDEELAVELQQRREKRRRARERDTEARMVGEQRAKQAGVGLLAHEALRDADAVDRLGERGGHAAEAVARGAGIEAELYAEVAVGHPEDRRERDHDEE